jgi:hypothetical protein
MSQCCITQSSFIGFDMVNIDSEQEHIVQKHPYSSGIKYTTTEACFL